MRNWRQVGLRAIAKPCSNPALQLGLVPDNAMRSNSFLSSKPHPASDVQLQRPSNGRIQMTGAERNGGCLCGNIRYRVTSQPRVHYCHCDMCRRATGSAFAVLGWVPSASLWWLKDKPFHRRSSPIAQRGFCRDCGSPITLAYDASPSEIALHIGTFDDPSDLTPHYNYGSGQRLGWICCGIDLPHHDREERW
ncbi:GFA family protein [Mesorhizobium sp. B2-3-5]|nr:GFA family protein [Mesorhizobium sp. B2-3-5]